MEKITIHHTVKKESEGTYYTVGFDVPAGVEKVTVSYRYNRLPAVQAMPGKNKRFMNVIDLGLEDGNGRFLGWSGGARTTVSVGEFDATNGYLTTPIVPGTWRILVGAYKVEPGGVDVDYEITFTEKKPRWFFGDLHMHSNASDGQYWIAELAAIAHKKGLDFIAVSDHNNYAENLHLPHVSGLTMIPAVEWTHYLGHMNFFGPKVPFTNSFIANSPEGMRAIVDDARNNGAVISVNHPKCDFVPYLWDDDTVFDMMEVWNGPMRPANLRAIAWWTDLLKASRKIPAVGGSDFHKKIWFTRMGNPVTAVFANSQSAEDLVDAISKGHSYVTDGLNGVRLDFQCAGKSFGETVALNDDRAELTFRAENTSPGMRLKLVTNEGTAAVFSRRENRAISGRFVIEKPGFAYLLVTKKILFWELVCAISNPIYFE